MGIDKSEYRELKFWHILAIGAFVVAINLAWVGGLLYLGWILVHWTVQH